MKKNKRLITSWNLYKKIKKNYFILIKYLCAICYILHSYIIINKFISNTIINGSHFILKDGIIG